MVVPRIIKDYVVHASGREGEHMTTCYWCWKEHRENTKVKAKHDKILEKVARGKIPCNLGKCAPHICPHLEDIYVAGLRSLDTNCNELLADINSIRRNREVLRRKLHVG